MTIACPRHKCSEASPFSRFHNLKPPRLRPPPNKYYAILGTRADFIRIEVLEVLGLILVEALGVIVAADARRMEFGRAREIPRGFGWIFGADLLVAALLAARPPIADPSPKFFLFEEDSINDCLGDDAGAAITSVMPNSHFAD